MARTARTEIIKLTEYQHGFVMAYIAAIDRDAKGLGEMDSSKTGRIIEPPDDRKGQTPAQEAADLYGIHGPQRHATTRGSAHSARTVICWKKKTLASRCEAVDICHARRPRRRPAFTIYFATKGPPPSQRLKGVEQIPRNRTIPGGSRDARAKHRTKAIRAVGRAYVNFFEQTMRFAIRNFCRGRRGRTRGFGTVRHERFPRIHDLFELGFRGARQCLENLPAGALRTGADGTHRGQSARLP